MISVKRKIRIAVYAIIAFSLLSENCATRSIGLSGNGYVTREELVKLKRDFLLMMGNFNFFSDRETENIIIQWQRREWRYFGNDRLQRIYMWRRYKNTVVMQRSARLRHYDHNIILASMFVGYIHHRQHGDLGKLFKGAVFIDIGSAILAEDGAPTVRDIYDDKRIEPHLKHIIATDINGPGCRYIDIYRRRRENLPFPVREVDIRLVTVDQFLDLTAGLLDEKTPLIFRSANSGPDLYYTTNDVIDHFRAMIRTFYDRDVLYFYNKFILFKRKNCTYFENIGRDSGVGTSHVRDMWDYVDWSSRKLKHCLIPNDKFITIVELGKT